MRTGAERLTRRVGAFVSRLARHPGEALDLLGGNLAWRWERLTLPRHDYTVQPWEEVIGRIERASGLAVTPHLVERTLLDAEAAVRRRAASLSAEAAFPPIYDADRELARLVYALCRALRPYTVVQTGVANGLLSAYVLAALEANGRGALHDIDLPGFQPGAEAVGALVPERLRARWTLHRGASRRVLPGLLAALGRVDMFVHDSLHTRRNVLRELRSAQPYLARPAVVAVDDVNENPAFHEWVEAAQPTVSGVLQQAGKDVMCGVSVFV